MNQPIIFFGASAYVIPTLEYLKDNYHLVLVVTTEQNLTDAVPAYCERNHISYIRLTSLKQPNTFTVLKALKVPVAVLAHFGLIVPQSVIELFPKGIVNIHPSLLPAYRGPTPGTSAILAGESLSGVSIMLLDKDVDHGPVLAQGKELILPDDTSISFYTRAFTKGANLLASVLPRYLEGTLVPHTQDHDKATFTTMLTRETGFFSDTNPPDARTLERMIRAYHPWPGVWTKQTDQNLPLFGKIIKFLPDVSRLPNRDEGSHYLLQPEGKKAMPMKDFFNGYPQLKLWLEQILSQKKE